MRISFTVLLTTGSLIIIQRLLGLIPNYGHRYFLGIPSEFAEYPSAVLWVTFYGSLVAFCASVYRALSQSNLVSEGVSRPKSTKASPELIAGIALSSLTSIIFVFAMAGAHGQIPKQALLWFLFTIVAGLLINQPTRTPLKKTFLYAAWPAAALFVYTLGLLVLAYFIAGSFVVSGGQQEITLTSIAKFGSLGFAVALAALPAIAAASLARDTIFSLVRGATELETAKLERLRANISAAIAILILLASAILGLYTGGASDG